MYYSSRLASEETKMKNPMSKFVLVDITKGKEQKNKQSYSEKSKGTKKGFVDEWLCQGQARACYPYTGVRNQCWTKGVCSINDI